MHKLIILILSFFILTLQIDAQEKTDLTEEINLLISQIKNSSSNDRRIAMNKLKIKLRQMNKESRKKIMLDLQKSFTAKSTSLQRPHNTSGPQNSSQTHMQLQNQGGANSMRNGHQSGGRR